MGEINSKEIIRILWLHWKKLSIVAIIAIIVSAFISSPWIMKPKYKSTAVVYPTNLMTFSRESHTEQLLQFFNSDEVKNNLIKKFDLYQHYDIDPSSERAYSKLTSYYNSNITISSTLYESIDIEVIDESPAFAQKLAYALIDEVNLLVTNLKKEKVKEYIASYSNQLTIKKNEIDSLEARLKFMRTNYGLLDFKSQAKVMTKKMGKGSLSEEDKKMLNGLKEYGGEYILLQEQLAIETSSYKELKLNYDKNLLDLNGHLSYTTIVSKPNLPDKKCSPLRLVIVLIFTLSSLFLASTVTLIGQKNQR